MQSVSFVCRSLGESERQSLRGAGARPSFRFRAAKIEEGIASFKHLPESAEIKTGMKNRPAENLKL
jgi:hypothetical protein